MGTLESRKNELENNFATNSTNGEKLFIITMATKTKTTQADASVNDFINAFVDKEEKKEDSYRLIELMREWSGCEPKMWGPTIIGFGRYHYGYGSGHEYR